MNTTKETESLFKYRNEHCISNISNFSVHLNFIHNHGQSNNNKSLMFFE